MEKEGLGMKEQLVDATHIIAKGKRTKRLRLLFPCGGGATSTCSSVNSGDSSSTTTFESAERQEDEDMAKCLILLAQGGGSEDSHHQKKHDGSDDDGNNKTEKGRKFAEMATATTNTKIGNFFIYECKTCNRTFPSFQALGGHRASHKKPKLIAEEKKPPSISQQQPQSQPRAIANYDQFEETEKPHIKTGPPISLHRAFNSNKTKIHECSICGSEFTSGQALGGHMRRHRAANATTQVAAVAAVKVEAQPRIILELDLNLPAPEEDLRESKFQFTAAPALVDCHY